MKGKTKGCGATMNVLMLGSGAEERGWASWLLARAEHRLDAAFPGFSEPALAGIPLPRDLDDALARPGIDAVIVGGPIEQRGEVLRRAAAEGLAIICLHPPGPDSEAYYQVALSRAETGAVIVPYLPLRLHPGVETLRQAIASAELGNFRGLKVESPCPDDGIDLARVEFPRLVDGVRAILGEIEALTATGEPPGDHPDIELMVQLRAVLGRRAELRLWSGSEEPSRVALLGAGGSLTLEFDPLFQQPALLIRRASSGQEHCEELERWDPHEAIFAVMTASTARRGGPELPSPNLQDATRAMELSEATTRSLRRGRTIELYYEPITEEANFKSVMTSTGCVILLIALFVLPLALAGPALGWNWTIFIAYLIPPVLVIFIVMQVLRFAVRREEGGETPRRDSKVERG
jgi:myo-inositol 2-dehydrogenase/D-chiro-inositol 1-dehydrogenase